MGTGRKAAELKIEWICAFTPPVRHRGVDKDTFRTWQYNLATDISFQCSKFKFVNYEL